MNKLNLVGNQFHPVLAYIMQHVRYTFFLLVLVFLLDLINPYEICLGEKKKNGGQLIFWLQLASFFSVVTAKVNILVNVG